MNVTYQLTDSEGRVVASGLPSWAAAARLANAYMMRNLILVTITPEKIEESLASARTA